MIVSEEDEDLYEIDHFRLFEDDSSPVSNHKLVFQTQGLINRVKTLIQWK